MTTNSKMIAAIDLQQYFVDKDTGAPLSAGVVTFYKDVNRTELKPVYTITGSPPNYTYAVLPNPLTLSSVGTFSYLSQDIIPYYFPYTGTQSDNTGEVELYYITVESRNPFNVPQFTREAWPPNVNNGGDPITDAGYRNLIPNGQFWAHTDIVGTSTPPVESIGGVDTQFVAQGGWSFRRTTGGGSTFNNSFTRIITGIPGIDDFPRYAFNYVCTSFNVNDQVRDFAIQWPDVNKFTTGNPLGTQQYTLFFAGKSNDANTYTFDLRMVRYYGTGGSPSATTDVSIGSVIISTSYATKLILIDGFPDDGGTIGTNNDDFVMLALRGPESSASVQITDFVLAPNNVAITSFPLQTTADMLSRGVAGWMDQPNPNAEDLYLPPILTPKGMTFDKSQIGRLEALTYLWDYATYGSVSPDSNLIVADGSSYKITDYSPIGVPYRRLGEKYLDTNGNYIWGTGIDFVTSYVNSDVILLSNNNYGTQSATVDGASPTGFTIAQLCPGRAANVVNSYVFSGGSTIGIIDTNLGLPSSAVNAGTSLATVERLLFDTDVPQFFTVAFSVAPPAGSYFSYSLVAPGGSVYVWYTVNGIGVDPAPGGTGYRVAILSTDTMQQIALKTRNAVMGSQSTLITTLPASSITGGDYFVFYANGKSYAVWYRVGGVGSAPNTFNETIQVNLIGSEINSQVATATVAAINAFMFAVPNTKGGFLMGANIGGDDLPGDLMQALRFSLMGGAFSSPYNLGSYQNSSYLQHSHEYQETGLDTILGPTTSAGTVSYSEGETSIGPTFNASFPRNTFSTKDVTSNGYPQTVPFNLNVVFAVRY